MSERTFLILFFLCCLAAVFIGATLAFWMSPCVY